MWAIVKKDLYVQRKSLGIMTAVILFFYLLFGLGSGPSMEGVTMLPIFIMVFTYFLTTGTIYEEARNQGHLWLRTLPLTATDLVNAKYLIVLLVSGSFFLLIWLLAQLTDFIRPDNPSIPWPPMLGFTQLAWFLCGLFLALYFRFGYNKTRLYIRYLLILIILVPYAVAYLSTLPFFPSWLNLITILAHPATPWLAGLLAVLFYLGSWVFSLHSYQNPDRLHPLG